MKKRLLALCLAAALLLGMMPALTLATSAETVTDTQVVTFGYPVADHPNFVYSLEDAYSYPIGTGSNSYTFNWLDVGAFQIRSSAATSDNVTFGANVDLDHTKQVAVSYNLGLDSGHFKADGTGTVSLADGKLAYNGVLVTLKDSAANGGVVYALFYRHANERVGFKFIIPDGNGGITTTDLINFGLFTAYSPLYTTKLIWNVDGTVTVKVIDTSTGTEYDRGTTAVNVTWTHEQASIMPAAEEGFRGTVHFEDYSFSSASLSQMRLYQCEGGFVISHTYEVAEPAEPAALDSYFTAETLTADNALTEDSWKHADYATVGGYDAAVLVNQGTAYVALKSDTVTDGTTVTVKLGETQKSATFAGGVAEVEFPGAVSGYDVETELTVGAEKASVTFVAKALSSQGVAGETATTKVAVDNPVADTNFVYTGSIGAGSNSLAFNWQTSGGGWYRIRTVADGRESVTFGANVDLDHTKQVEVSHVLTVDINNFAITDANGDTITLNNGKLTYNGILYTLKDSAANGGVVYAVLHKNSSSQLTLSFIIPDGNGGITLEHVRLGMVPSRNTIKLIWNVDGTVTVQIDAATPVDKTTTQNVTWTNAQAAIMPAAEEGFRGTLHSEDHASISASKLGQVYLWKCTAESCGHAEGEHVGITVAQTEYTYTVDIETTLEDDLYAYFDSFDTENVVSLPAAFEHPYLGIVPLTWGCEIEGLVSPNGVIKTPSEDTWAVVWAEVNGEVLYEAEVLIKAAEPVYGAFTYDLNTAWHLTPYTQIGTSADSVAVLATDKDHVYVAVKSTAASATVTLGTEEQTVEIIDGIGYAAFENVGLSAFGDSRELKIVTANATLETKVVLDEQINLDATGGATTNVSITYPVSDSNFAYVGSVGTANSNAFKWRETDYQVRAAAGGRESVTFGTSLDLDHTKTVAVSHYLGLDYNNFPFNTNGTVTLNGGVLAYDGILYTLKDSAANGGVVYALFYRHASERVGIKFIVPDGNGGIATTDMINYGFFPKGGADRFETKFVWNVDGTVTVRVTDALNNVLLASATTAENVTWTHEQAAIMPAAEEGFRGTLHFEEYAVKDDMPNALAQAYINHIDGVGFIVNYPDAVANIEIPAFEGWNVDLGSDIGLNFYLNMPVKTGAVANVSLAGEPFKTIDFSALKAGADGRYMGEANIAAVQMTDEIKVELSVYGFAVEAQTMTSTVKAYVEELKKPEYALSDAKIALVDAMLTYGAAAQKYFSYKTDALASDANPSEDLKGLTGNYAATVDGSLTGITAKSATLLLQENVRIRYYFDAETVEGLSFKLGEKELTPAYHEGKGYWYVEIGVEPQNMDEDYTVTVTPVEGEGSLSVTYSCMTYLVNMADSQVANLPALMMAMYDYYVAAETVASAN